MVGKCIPHTSFPISPTSKGLPDRGDDGRRLGHSWVGGSLIAGGILPGGVVSSGAKVSHKPEGDKGCPPSPQEHDASRGVCSLVSRQPNSSGIHQSDGGDQINPSMRRCNLPMANRSGEKGMGEGCLGPQRGESVVGHAVQNKIECLGDIPVAIRGSVPLGPLVHSRGGCIREQEVPCPPRLLQLVSGPGIKGKGCFFPDEMASKSVLLPSCPANSDDPFKDSKGWGIGNSGGTRMADSHMVGPVDTHYGGGPRQIRFLQGDSDSSVRTESSLPTPTSCLSGQGEGDFPLLTEQARSLMQNDIRDGTHKLYRSRFRIFTDYCTKLGHDPTSCPIEIVANFLAMLKDKGRKYQTICGYRSAISRYHCGQGLLPLGESKLVKRITKACFNLAPPIPKYANMWNADVLMCYLAKQYPNSDLSLKDLGIKTVALISILSLSRQSSVAVLAPEFQVVEDKIVIPLTGLEKTSRPGHVRGEVVLPAGSDYPPLSLHQCLSEYCARTEHMRAYYEKAEGRRPPCLFISNVKPYQSVSSSTLAKWLLSAMDNAGIDTACFKAHSTRSAGASTMRNKGFSLSQVLSRGYWSDKSRTFHVFYDRSVRQPADR